MTKACTLVLADSSGAEEVAAEAFVRLWSRWSSIQDDDHAGGFVFKTAMRLCAKRMRSRVREALTPVVERRGADEMARVLDRDEIIAGLSRLALRQRQAVVLRDWAGFETADIASILGIRESTIRVHLARGRQALRRSLSVEEREA